MGTENKYVYFSLTRRQLKLLVAALLRSLLKIGDLGDALSEAQRSEAMEIEAIRNMFESLGNTDRDAVKIILSEVQLKIVSISVKTTQLSLDGDHALKDEYEALMDAITTGTMSRRTTCRDEKPTNELDKV